MCRRYPGRRPSDYHGELDDYQSFQLDSALALRGQLEDRDYINDILHVLLEGMRGIMKAQGAKPGKLKKPEPNFVPREPGESSEKTVEELLAALGGSGVAIENG